MSKILINLHRVIQIQRIFHWHGDQLAWRLFLQDDACVNSLGLQHAAFEIFTLTPQNRDCVCTDIQSEDQNQFFTFKVRTFWQSEVKISVLALWLVALSALFHNMGVGGMDVILSLYVPGMFRDVWKNVLTLNVLYTDLSSLWMLGQTHYTHVCIVCPHFECRDR